MKALNFNKELDSINEKLKKKINDNGLEFNRTIEFISNQTKNNPQQVLQILIDNNFLTHSPQSNLVYISASNKLNQLLAFEKKTNQKKWGYRFMIIGIVIAALACLFTLISIFK